MLLSWYILNGIIITCEPYWEEEEEAEIVD